MSSVPRPSDVAATEERYYARQAEREEALRRLHQEGILAADDPARVRRRLARLGVDETAATAVPRLTALTNGPRLAAPAASSDLRSFGWTPLIEQEGKAIIGEYVNIIQHPGGEPKQLALRENQLVDVLPDFLHYETDTAPGSSGSPVFNDQWEVVALHHSGVPRKDAAGNILAIGGGRWDPSMGEHRVDWIANEGVRVSRILTNLRERQLDAAQGALRRELVAAASPPTESLPQTDGGAPATAAGAGVVAAGETGFTIPL